MWFVFLIFIIVFGSAVTDFNRRYDCGQLKIEKACELVKKDYEKR